MSVPVLTTNGGFNDWSFSVADNLPPNWNLERSTDGGATWLMAGTNSYGNDIFYGSDSGEQYRGVRADGGGADYGPVSNIIIVP